MPSPAVMESPPEPLLTDPVRRRYGRFGRFTTGLRRRAWYGALLAAPAAGIAAGVAELHVGGPAQIHLFYTAIPLSTAIILAAAIQAALTLAGERESGTFEGIVLTPYPRGAIGRAIVLGSFIRTATLGSVPYLGWFAWTLTCYPRDWGVAGWCLLAAPAFLAVAFIGSCIGCYCTARARGVVGAVAEAAAQTILSSLLLSCTVPCSGLFADKMIYAGTGIAGALFWLTGWAYLFWSSNVGWFTTHFESRALEDAERAPARD